MPLPNGVDPWGQIHPICPSAGWMGNRGILHDQTGRIITPWQHKSWVICALSFKGRDRKPLMQPHRYSELFFLDEATAFAAGHRPCAECRNSKYREFKTAWRQAKGTEVVSCAQIDRILHTERATREKGKQTFFMLIATLPIGAMFALGGRIYLQSRHGPLLWSPVGYKRPDKLFHGSESVEVLTPPSILDVLRIGYIPQFHESADP